MRLKKGLDIPILGKPIQDMIHNIPVNFVAINGLDYIGLKVKVLVKIGQKVILGQPLLEDKKSPLIKFVSPGTGVVMQINISIKRVFESIIIKLDNSNDKMVTFDKYDNKSLLNINKNQVQNNLYNSGLWTAFRTRPYSKIPIENTTPSAIFITAMDSEPLTVDAGIIISNSLNDFNNGLKIIKILTNGIVYVCHNYKNNLGNINIKNIKYKKFSGPHPSGLVGTHIHFLEPIYGNKIVWYINYQDVIAIGKLFISGILSVERIIAITGPRALKPKLICTRLGASIVDLLKGQVKGNNSYCPISGSVLSGFIAKDKFGYLGRYHRQICLLDIDKTQSVFGWLTTNMKKYAFNNVHFSSFFKKTLKFSFSTKLHGSRRAMVPFGSYERVIPQDILITQLLRSILILDIDQAQKLGVLEFDEEDLALCTFICHSKYEYGKALRLCLEKIEREG